MAVITSIVYQPLDRNYTDRLGNYIRESADAVNLVVDVGIEGDQKGSHHPERNLNILSQEWLAEKSGEGYRTAPGEFGEQMIVSGLAVETLQKGVQLQLGAEAVVEVTKPRTGCDRLVAAQGKSIAGIGAIGILAKVVKSGAVRVGDVVQVLEQPG
jgi:MOSC domain-containing protein YiiM